MSIFRRLSIERRPAAALMAAALVAVSILFPGGTRAQVTGVSYTLTPVVEGMQFENDAALESSIFYGGKLGFGFGEFIELSGLYLFGSDVRTDFGDLSGFDEATTALLGALPGRSTNIIRFGGELKFNIGRGAMFPFFTLGTGVMRFDPENLNESKTIYLSGGLGLQIGYRERYTIVLQANGLTYRYNPAATLLSDADLASLGMAPDEFDFIDVRNFSGSVGVKFYLGGRARGKLSEMDLAFQEQFRGGWRGIDFRLEPAAGEIDFNDALGFRPNHRVAGISAGIDLGSYAGLRGFYWRGIEDGSWTKFDDMQAYGGELKLAFADGSGGLTPYFTVGAGYMDVMSGYVGNGLAEPEDRPFAVGGIGLILPLGTALSVDAAVRSVLMSTSGVDNVSDPGDVKASTMFTVGISFGLGHGDRSGGVFGREMAASRVERERLASSVSGLERELDLVRSRMDSMASVAPGRRIPGRDSAAAAGGPGAPERDSRWVTLPLPDEGELYLRFGAPGGVSVETIEGEPVMYYIDPSTGTLVPAAAPAAPSAAPPAAPAAGAKLEPAPAAPPGASREQLEEIIRRVLRQERAPETEKAVPAEGDAAAERRVSSLQARIRDLEAQLADLRETGAAARRPQEKPTEIAPVIVETPAAEAAQRPEPAGGAIVEVETARTPSTRFAGLAPLAGYNVDTPRQGLIGIRADFHHRTRPYRLTPELVMGFGDGKTTTNVNLNGIYDLGVGILDRLYPYGGVGLGFLNREELELVLNLVIGSDIWVGSSTLFLEYMNQDFFDNNRLLTGYRFSF